MKQVHVVALASGIGVALVAGGVAIGLVIRAPQSSERATAEPLMPAAPVAAAAAPAPAPTQSLDDAVMGIDTFGLAVAATKPMMSDEYNKDSLGAGLFGRWSAKHVWSDLWWSDVGVAKDETSFALAQKDPDDARGKRMCVSGGIVQIEVEKTDVGKINIGLMHSWSDNLFRFIAVGSSGTLVGDSAARFCGVVTGKYDYSNSGGGTGHAIEMVGMFDLPENKKKKPMAGLTIAAPSQ